MGAESKIEWTHHTFNPWWGCARVSPGCEHCYAETLAKRFGTKWGYNEERRFFGAKHWDEPIKWNEAAKRAGVRRRVFCASMADVFEDRADLIEERANLWRLIAGTPNLDWLLLTKRPENLLRMVPWMAANPPTPWPNVWLGTTVEDQRRANERIPGLLKVPAAVRFLSCEPLLERVDLTSIPYGIHRMDALAGYGGWAHHRWEHKIDWVIVGGESGPGARRFDVAWARIIIGQCRAAGVPVHIKQLGATPIVGDLPRRVAGITDRKGGNWSEWPEDLRVREYPKPLAREGG